MGTQGAELAMIAPLPPKPPPPVRPKQNTADTAKIDKSAKPAAPKQTTFTGLEDNLELDDDLRNLGSSNCLNDKESIPTVANRLVRYLPVVGATSIVELMMQNFVAPTATQELRISIVFIGHELLCWAATGRRDEAQGVVDEAQLGMYRVNLTDFVELAVGKFILPIGDVIAALPDDQRRIYSIVLRMWSKGGLVPQERMPLIKRAWKC